MGCSTKSAAPCTAKRPAHTINEGHHFVLRDREPLLHALLPLPALLVRLALHEHEVGGHVAVPTAAQAAVLRGLVAVRL